MPHRYINRLLEYCRPALLNSAWRTTIGGFNGAGGLLNPVHSSTHRPAERIPSLSEFSKIRSVKKITYQHLVDFDTDYEDPSINVKKSGEITVSNSDL